MNKTGAMDCASMTANGGLPGRVTVLIVGAGPGGLCMGINLSQAGISDFLIVEKASGVGGTWWHNRYPGAECDVESHLYSFSFEQKPDWSKPYAGQAEILEYIEHVAVKYEMLPYCRFGVEVKSAIWLEHDTIWRVSMADGRQIEARFLVSAIGMFNEIAIPEIGGLPDFTGETIHTARWPEQLDLTGKKVAIIGSAASAIQTASEIAPIVGSLDLYQRTPQWVMPKNDNPYSPEELEHFRAHPDLVEARRKELLHQLEVVLLFSDAEVTSTLADAARHNLEAVKEPGLRRRLTPDWDLGCRRPLISNKYYPIFNQPNVRLVDARIQQVQVDAIVTSDGALRPADVIILATGFQTTRFLSALDITGRDGLHIESAWADGAIAYLGITTAGFPNLFMLYGPNTNGGSFITMLEMQAIYALRKIKEVLDRNSRWIDVRDIAQTEYNERLQSDINNIAVWNGDCGGYYRATSGRIVTQFPYTMTRYNEMLAVEDSSSYLWH